MTTEQKPPIRPRVEQLGEKIGGVAIALLMVGLTLYLLNQQQPLDLLFINGAFAGLLSPALVSLAITGAAYGTGMGLGFALGWLRTIRALPARLLATGWIEAIRGTPLFVQLLFLFSILGFYNPGDLPTGQRVILTGYLALMINTSAYQAEIFRAGLQSVHAGQVEAARAVGLRYWGTMRHVILPQAVRVVLPPLTSEFTSLLKASALLFAISVRELTYEGRILSFVSGNIVEVYVMVTTLYLAMTVPLTFVVEFLERRFRIPGFGVRPEEPTRRERGRGLASRVARVDVAAVRGLGRSLRARNVLTPASVATGRPW